MVGTKRINKTGSINMKIGDLVRIRASCDIRLDGTPTGAGIVSELSEPTLVFPYRVATIIFAGVKYSGILESVLEVISEDM